MSLTFDHNIKKFDLHARNSNCIALFWCLPISLDQAKPDRLNVFFLASYPMLNPTLKCPENKKVPQLLMLEESLVIIVPGQLDMLACMRNGSHSATETLKVPTTAFVK